MHFITILLSATYDQKRTPLVEIYASIKIESHPSCTIISLLLNYNPTKRLDNIESSAIVLS